MLNRSTSMLLAALSLLVPVYADVLQNQKGTMDNSAQAKSLWSQASPLDGTFKIVSKTGVTLTYSHDDNGANLFPAPSLSSVLDDIKHILNSDASQDLDIESNDDGSVRISFGTKCMSAQWADDLGIDRYAVAYECGVGTEADKSSTVRDAKQWYILQPVEGVDDDSSDSTPAAAHGQKDAKSTETASSTAKAISTGKPAASSNPISSVKATSTAVKATSSAKVTAKASGTASSSAPATSSSGAACPKSPEWVWRHPQNQNYKFYEAHPECVDTAKAPKCLHDYAFLHRHPSYIYKAGHRECLSVYKGSHANRFAKRASKWYRIVLTDHIEDQEARCVTSKKITSFGDASSAETMICDETSEDQLWQFIES